MPKWILILALLFAVSFSTTVGSVLSTDKQIRSYLGMPSYVGIVPEHVEAAVMAYSPIGSSRHQVERALTGQGIGVDEDSVCETSKDQGQLTCKLGMKHHSWELLRETYTVSFAFDSSGFLRKVSVRSGLSGARKIEGT
jgi:hypothetical protein